MFVSTDREDVITAFGEVMAWVNASGQFLAGAKADFARGADGWLVAYARVTGAIVVTHERTDPKRRNKVPLPNVCEHFGVEYIDTFDMLRHLGFQFRAAAS